MAKKPTGGRRKLVEFDAETWHALNLLSRETMKTFQELADEAAICCTSMHGHRFEGGARQSAKDEFRGKGHPRGIRDERCSYHI
jgi:hypothetical protein